MDAEIISLKELITLRCDGLLREVIETQRLQRETNGRVRTAEEKIANFAPRVSTLEREVGEVRECVNGIGSEVSDELKLVRNQVSSVAAIVAADARNVASDKATTEAGENRRIRLWDVVIFAAGIGATAAVIEFVKAIR